MRRRNVQSFWFYIFTILLAIILVTLIVTTWDFIAYSIKSLFLTKGIIEKYNIKGVLAVDELRIYDLSKYYRNLTC